MNNKRYQWISVDTMKPMHKTPFLGTDGEEIFACYWNEEEQRYTMLKNAGTKMVTHWMALPMTPGSPLKIK